MKHTRTLTTAFALLLIAGSGLAAAGPEKEKSKDKDLLRGPKVVNNDRTTNRVRKDSMQDQRKHQDSMKVSDKELNRPISVREILGAIRQLQSPKAEVALNLTDEQRNQISEINTELRTAMRKFQEEHKNEFQAMRQRARPGTPPADGADKNRQRDHKPVEPANRDRPQKGQRAQRGQDAQNAQDRPDALSGQRPAQNDRAMKMREKLRDMIENSPPNKEALAKLRTVLTPEQFKLVRSHIHKTRAEIAPDGQRPGQMQRQRTDRQDDAQGRRRGNDAEDAHPERPARRRINADRVNNNGQRDAKNSKRTKDNKPPLDDD